LRARRCRSAWATQPILDPALLAAICGPDGLGGQGLGPQFGQDHVADALRPTPVLAVLTEQARRVPRRGARRRAAHHPQPGRLPPRRRTGADRPAPEHARRDGRRDHQPRQRPHDRVLHRLPVRRRRRLRRPGARRGRPRAAGGRARAQGGRPRDETGPRGGPGPEGARQGHPTPPTSWPPKPTSAPSPTSSAGPVGTLLGWSTAPSQAGTWGLLDPIDTENIVAAASLDPRTHRDRREWPTKLPERGL
jgi:hypothetical protein